MVDTPGEGVSVLEEALARVRLPLTAAMNDALRSDLCAFVDERRAAGWSVERVIIAVKRAALDAGFDAGATSPGHNPNQYEKVLAEMVRWCIDHYYSPAVGDG